MNMQFKSLGCKMAYASSASLRCRALRRFELPVVFLQAGRKEMLGATSRSRCNQYCSVITDLLDEYPRPRQWPRTNHGHCSSTCMSRPLCAGLGAHSFSRYKTYPADESALHLLCRMDSRGSESTCSSAGIRYYYTVVAREAGANSVSLSFPRGRNISH